MIQVTRNEGNFVALNVSGELTAADVQTAFPILQAAEEKGALHLLVDLTTFQGIDDNGMGEHFRLDTGIADHIAALALIGDKKWQPWADRLTPFLTAGRVQLFDPGDAQDASKWVQDGL